MTHDETNRFLTEAMGLKWHEKLNAPFKCFTCAVECVSYHPDEVSAFLRTHKNIDFFTAEGFFVAWEWARSKEWWREFSYQDSVKYKMAKYDPYHIIHRERFALALAEFLEGRVA